MRRRLAALASVMLVTWAMPASASQPPDAAALMRRIAAEPHRYGGSLQGTVPGVREVPGAVDQPLVHLSIGLAFPDAHGMLRGDAILFDRQRRLIGSGPVVGRIAGGPTAGTAACSLRLSLPTEEVTLAGVCTDTALSGEIVSRPHRRGLLTRLVSWWGDDAVAGRYWLTSASFDPAP